MNPKSLKYSTTFLLFIFLFEKTIAQDTTIWHADALQLTGYIETYYSFDLGNPSNHERPSFFYSFNRHNEVNANLGFIKAAYTKKNTRANFALMAGTYAQYNLAGEQGLLKNILEANIGVKVSRKHELWIDAGVMPSHIGFESAIGKDCWNLTRSLLADNSPYFESGIKLGYTSKKDKWYLSALFLNGWQRIQRANGDQTPAFGTQITFKPNKKILLNWSTYIGADGNDSIDNGRFFNNFYGQFQPNDKLGITLGIDVGLQQKARTSLFIGDGLSLWYSPIAIIRYQTSAKTKLSIRGEYYDDGDGVIIATVTPNGFKTFGYSANVDFIVADNTLFRIEARGLKSKDKIFELDNEPSYHNFFFTSSLSLSF